MYRATIHRGADGLARIYQEWGNLYSRLAQPRVFQLYGWWRSYLTALAPIPDAVRFITVYDSDRLLVALLVIEPCDAGYFGIHARVLGLPFHYHLPLGDMLLDPSASMEQVASAVRETLTADGENWDWLQFRWILKKSSIDRFTDYFGRRLRTVLHTCDYLDCARPYDSIIGSLSRNFQSNLKNSRNRLKREGEVVFSSATDTAELQRLFPEFLEVEASGWKADAGTAIKLHPGLVQFYRALIHELGPQGAVVFNVMRIAGRCVAMQLCLRDAHTLYILKLAYDDQWSRVRPGNLLVDWVVQRACAERSFRYLNLLNDPPWFKSWRPESLEVLNVYVYGCTRIGTLSWHMARAKQRLRPIYKCGQRILRLR